MNEKVVWNFFVKKNHYYFFTLAAKFDPPGFYPLTAGGELGGIDGDKVDMSGALRISKIISRNLEKRYRIVWTTGVKMMFPLAAHLDGISQPSLIGARFGDSVGGKSQKPVNSLV